MKAPLLVLEWMGNKFCDQILSLCLSDLISYAVGSMRIMSIAAKDWKEQDILPCVLSMSLFKADFILCGKMV